MRGRAWGCIAVVSACVLVLVAAFASAASGARARVDRLVVVEHETTDTVVDLTTNGDSTGDLLTFHNDLYDESNADVVGTDQGDCIRIEVGVRDRKSVV